VRWLGILVVVLLSVALSACGAGDENTTSGRTVVAAFYPLAWAVEQIVGDDLEVVNVTPVGAEPHDVELTPRDVEAVRDADLVVYLGRGFQPALEQALETRSGRSLDLLDGQVLLSGRDEEGQKAQDPHLWLDPTRYAEMVERIGRELGRRAASDRLALRLHALDREFRAGLETCKQHEIVASHAAFGYLAERYGLEQIALTGIAPEAEPSPRDLVSLVHEVEKSGSTTVFFETLVSPKLAQTVARESGAKTAVLDPIEGLTNDEVAAGDDYFSVMRANLRALRTALRCR
jgi:zinc transport system substrate-binding protein